MPSIKIFDIQTKKNTMMMTLFQAASKGNLGAVKNILRNASDQSTDITEKKNTALLGKFQPYYFCFVFEF